MLAFVPKRHAYQYVTYNHCDAFILFCRNQAYQACSQLAVLDNNAHCLRDQACSKKGTAIHARNFQEAK